MIGQIGDRIHLSDGQEMPGYGFGVYKAGGRELVDALAAAFASGYRYIDTAAFYENEKEVGEAIRASGLPREELFILSKIWPSSFSDPEGALESSLRRLGLDYLDGYLLHWPGLDTALRLKAFEALLREQSRGRIRVLGVSNFIGRHLAELHENFGLWATVNQIEVHPLFQQRELCSFCAERGIQVVSWSPLGRGGAVGLPAVREMAAARKRSPAQIVLRWQIQKNLLPIPKSVHPDRIRENADVFDFTLSAGEMAVIDGLELPDNAGRTGKDPLVWPPLP